MKHVNVRKDFIVVISWVLGKQFHCAHTCFVLRPAFLLLWGKDFIYDYDPDIGGLQILEPSKLRVNSKTDASNLWGAPIFGCQPRSSNFESIGNVQPIPTKEQLN